MFLLFHLKNTYEDKKPYSRAYCIICLSCYGAKNGFYVAGESPLEQMRTKAMNLIPEASVNIAKYNFDNQLINNAIKNTYFHEQKFKKRRWTTYALLATPVMFFSDYALHMTTAREDLVGVWQTSGTILLVAGVFSTVVCVPITVSKLYHKSKQKRYSKEASGLLESYETESQE